MRQTLYRDVNERVSRISRAFGDDVAMIMVCECGRHGCIDRVKVTRAEYEAVRAEASHFVVAFGHRRGSLIRETDRFEVERPLMR